MAVAPVPAIAARRFLIVTPAFNAEAFIDEAIASVLQQHVPGYALHYHVQDGGSTDGTPERLQAWERRLRDGHFPVAGDVTFSFATERDGGMYDALQRGFARLAPQDGDILTWINSDDSLAQGALVTVAGVFGDVAGCEFLSGRVALLNEAGAVVVLAPAIPYARGALADGLHDGRQLSFLMQEGTFFSGRVWNAVGGVDASFRLAGDWDLWRRMARVAGHRLADTVTGYHRRRAGQLSGDMAAYYREVDAAPTLLPSELGPLGAVVTFDQASGRWVETAYDPSATAAPALLRDGRPEASATCRPMAGFAAPEGPYPQYQLPGAIRWIKDRRAELSVTAPVAGRYRIRLTLRASRNAIVVGIGIDTREPQPIALEPPIPLVDQVIETVRWLDAGDNRLTLDGGGSPEDRLVLLVRCEVTGTDETFSPRAILTPARSKPLAGRLSAIVILCEDDEPDLLDRSLVGCAVALSGAAVFVVRDPASVVLDRVLRFRCALVAGCFDSVDGRAEVEAVRRALHAAGHATILIVQRGSLPKPDGIEAASARLDASGAGTTIGLIDERDSAGNTLQLVGNTRADPLLLRAESPSDTVLRLGCALTQTVAYAHGTANPPVIWVVDGDQPILGRTPAILMAAGLALLGYDVRHTVAGSGTVPPIDALVIASQGLADRTPGVMTVGRVGAQLRLTAANGIHVDLPFAFDTDLLLPRDRDAARRRLGFAPHEPIVCIAEDSVAGTDDAIARADAMSDGAVRILNFGRPGSSPSSRESLLGAVADPQLLSYLLGAADAAVTMEGAGSPLAGAAWACGLRVEDRHGAILWPQDAGAGNAGGQAGDTVGDTRRSRAIVVAARSLASLAIAIDAHCPALGAVGGSSPLRLRGGTVAVRSYPGDQAGSFDSPNGYGSVAAFGPATPFVAADGERGLSIDARGADILVCLKRAAIAALRLHCRGTPGETWTVRIGVDAVSFEIDGNGVATVAIPGPHQPGPIRIGFEPGHADTGSLLHVVGLSAIGGPVPAAPPWEETRFALVPAGNCVSALEGDGDWRRETGFLPMEPAVPQEGLHVPFHWSRGDTCVIRVRVTAGGARTLHLALSAGVRDQRVRPTVAGRTYDWCRPLSGPIGHVEHRGWLVDWPVGDVAVSLELSDVLRAPGQDLGIILFAATLAPARP